jgi:hypothetical protein
MVCLRFLCFDFAFLCPYQCNWSHRHSSISLSNIQIFNDFERTFAPILLLCSLLFSTDCVLTLVWLKLGKRERV